MAAPFWQAGNLYIPGDIVQPVTAPAPNVPTVSNGDFGAGATGWDFTGGAAYVTTGGYGGGGCVRLPGNVADGVALNESKLFVQAGGTLTATAMIQQGASVRGATSGWVEIQWFDGSDTLVDEARGTVVDDGSGGAWKQSTVSSPRPAAATYGRAGIHLTSVADHSHPIWGDNLTVSGASAGLPEGLVYKAVQPEAGTSAANEPTWPSILGQQVIDNDVIWEAVTTSRITWTASPRYVSGATEPVWPTDMGAMVQDGTINWKAVPRRIEDEKCPNTKVVAILASKVFAADRDIVRFSATANPLDWTTAEDAGYLATGLQQANANDMAVLVPYRKNLTAWNASSFQNWQADPDPASMAILDQMDGIGSTWPRAAVPVANDLFYLAALGVRTIGIANAAENLVAGDVGAPVDMLVQAAIRVATQNDSKVIATYYPSAGQYWLSFSDYPPSPLALYGELPNGLVGTTFAPFKYEPSGGVRPYGPIAIRSGALPSGLSMDVDGRVSGTPETSGTFMWSVGILDADGSDFVLHDTSIIADPATVETIPVLVQQLQFITGGGAPGIAQSTEKDAPLNPSINARSGDWAIFHVRSVASDLPPLGNIPPESRFITYMGDGQTGQVFSDLGWHGDASHQASMDVALVAAGMSQYIGTIQSEPVVGTAIRYQSTPFEYPVEMATQFSSRIVIYRYGTRLDTAVFLQYPDPAQIPSGAEKIAGLPGYYVTPAGVIYRVAWDTSV